MTSKFKHLPNQDKAWWLIENGLDIDLLYPEHMRQPKNNPSYISYMESIMEPNEEFILLDDSLYEYAITSNGRIINCKKQNQLFGFGYAAKQDDLRVDIRDKKFMMSTIFEEQGWEFNIKKIMKMYEK